MNLKKIISLMLGILFLLAIPTWGAEIDDTEKIQNRFVDNQDGTITDLRTNLMWMKTPNEAAKTYKDAVDYCRNLKHNGLTGWRLPTIAELKKIVDKKQRNPALPKNHPFSGIITHIMYWSKTDHKFSPEFVYSMNFWHGKVTYLKKIYKAMTWPVRDIQLPE